MNRTSDRIIIGLFVLDVLLLGFSFLFHAFGWPLVVQVLVIGALAYQPFRRELRRRRSGDDAAA